MGVRMSCVSRCQKALIADLMLILMVVIWGSTFFMIKEHIRFVDPVGMLVYRFGAAAAVLAGFLLFKRRPLWRGLLPGFTAGFWLGLIYLSQNIGMVYTSASNSGFITALFVVFTPLFSIVCFRQRPAPLRLMAAGLSVAGLWFLTGGFSGMNRGDWITLIAPVAGAFYVLFCDRYLKRGLDPLVFCFHQFLAVAGLSLVWMVLFKAPFQITSPATYWVIAYLTVFATLITFLVYAYVQRIATPMKCALIFALEPVFAALFAGLFGGETFSMGQVFGGFLIVVALIVAEIPVKKELKDVTYYDQPGYRRAA